MRRALSVGVLVVLAAVGAGVASARTASNVVPPTYAGVTQVTFSVPESHALVQEDPFEVVERSRGRWSVHLHVDGGQGELSYTATAGTLALRVSPEGRVSGSDLAPGLYEVSGVVSDRSGGQGTWHLTVVVSQGDH